MEEVARVKPGEIMAETDPRQVPHQEQPATLLSYITPAMDTTQILFPSTLCFTPWLVVLLSVAACVDHKGGKQKAENYQPN